MAVPFLELQDAQRSRLDTEASVFNCFLDTEVTVFNSYFRTFFICKYLRIFKFLMYIGGRVQNWTFKFILARHVFDASAALGCLLTERGYFVRAALLVPLVSDSEYSRSKSM
jgi:hypothetical protein